MAWAKLDDRFHEDPQVRRLFKTKPEALALFLMSISYAAGNETDGIVHQEWVESYVPKGAARAKLAGGLVELGWWNEHAAGFEISSFLKYNPSRQEVRERREARKIAGSKGGQRSRTQANAQANAQASAQANAQANAKQVLDTPGQAVGRNVSGRVKGRVNNSVSFQREGPTEHLVAAATILEGQWPDSQSLIEPALLNATAAYPKVDAIVASRLAVSWAMSDSWEMPAPATVMAAFKKLAADAPKRDERTERRVRGANALKTLLSSTIETEST
jgi:hypothetical protein